MYQPRMYRNWIKDGDLVSFRVVVKETDLYIRATSNLKSKAHKAVLKYRLALEHYIDRNPLFLTSLESLAAAEDAPRIARDMLEAGAAAGVGPMAAVAGAVAQFVGEELLSFSPEVIVENGGDIYIKSSEDRTVGIYAGDSPLTGRIGIEVRGQDTPLGICTSSGTVGHSLSFGKADAVVTVSPSASLADAAATAIGNLVIEAADIPRGIERAQRIAGLKGVVIIKGESLGVWGEIRLCRTNEA